VGRQLAKTRTRDGISRRCSTYGKCGSNPPPDVMHIDYFRDDRKLLAFLYIFYRLGLCSEDSYANVEKG